MKVGIVGVGFVGNAVRVAYELAGARVVCIDPAKGYNSTYSEIYKCDAVFICVSSPVSDDGSCDTSFLESVMLELKDYPGVIISKVTAPPDIYIKLQAEYPNLVHAPEFLRAVSANQDYLDGTVAIIGGDSDVSVRAAAIIVLAQKKVTQFKYLPIGEASLVKYIENCFLATKVVFMNEIQQLAEKTGLDYNSIKESIQLDPRMGTSHFDVPGADGTFGFSGYCFPKDTSALLKYAKDKQLELTVLAQAVSTNNIVRNGI